MNVSCTSIARNKNAKEHWECEESLNSRACPFSWEIQQHGQETAVVTIDVVVFNPFTRNDSNREGCHYCSLLAI